MNVNEKSIAKEWMADHKATEVVLQKYLNVTSQHPHDPSAGIDLAGPMLFLMVASWLERLWPPKEWTHPPASDRLGALKATFEKMVGRTPGYLVAWNFVSHLERLAYMAALVDKPLFTTDQFLALPENQKE